MSWLSLPAARSNWSRAALSASWPAPAVSCRYISKPLDWPRPGSTGGASAMTWPSRIFEKAPIARPAMADDVWPLPVRSEKSFSFTKAMAAFWPLPLKPKPTAAKTSSTLAFSSVRK